MRARWTVRTLALAALLVGAKVTAHGQNRRAVARYDARGRMVRAFNLTDRAEDPNCERFVHAGGVTRVEYDSAGHPAEFWIKEKGGRVRSFNLLDAEFDARDLKRVSGLLRSGSIVRVEAFGCGAGGLILTAWSITLIR